MSGPYDVLEFGAHPDDLEAVLSGTPANLVAKRRSVLFVDSCDREPTRHRMTVDEITEIMIDDGKCILVC
jgi:hypothetical protein